MKTWKQSTSLGILAILVFIVALFACDNNNGTTHTHEYGTVWKSNAIQHWHECSCGEKADTANHTWDWEITAPATTETEGLKTEKCIVCNATSGNTQQIEKLPLLCTCDPKWHYEDEEPCCEGVNCECDIIPLCKCTEKEKFLPCDCNEGRCECTVKEFGQINFGSESIKVFMTEGVTETQMDTIIVNIQEGYNILDDSDKFFLVGKIKEIRVVPTSDDVPVGIANFPEKGEDGKYIITFTDDRTAVSIRGAFMSWINNDRIVMAPQMQGNNKQKIA
jgi:hypothetical protein